MKIESNFQSYLNNSRKSVNDVLDEILKDCLKEVKKTSPQIYPMAEQFKNNCSGGKVIRGSLLKLGYELSGGKATKEIFKAGAAYEIFQTAILAHDDIIDQSLVRRNKPSLHCALGGDHRGISHAICLGDIGFFLAFKIFASLDFASERKTEAIQSFSQTMINTGLGEMLDIELSDPNRKRNKNDVLKLHELKTAWYTITGPLYLGGILAGANKKLLNEFVKFGQNLGIAFQIQDDILGIFGDEKTLGKSVKSDIEENKNTLLITYALTNANPAQKKILNHYYGKGKISNKQIEQIKKVFIDTGALKQSQAIAQRYLELGKKAIGKLSKDKATQTILTELADYLINRKK